MRILFTHEIFMPDFHGGGEALAYEISRRLADRGHEVTVVTTGDPKITHYENLRTIRMPVNRYLMNFSAPFVYRWAKGYDVILTNNYNACVASLHAGKMLKIPVYCMVHGMYGDKWIQMRGRLFGNLSKHIERLQICRDYTKIIFFSEFARDAGVSIGIPEDQTTVIHPGLDHGNFYVGEKEPFVLFVGRLSKQKGINYLVQAARELPHISFKVVGRDEEESWLKDNAPENVEFLGFVSQEELYDLYSRALIFCLPSVAETFGIVILDAMASGCAVVSTVPLDYEGIKVDVGDVMQLKDAISHLFEDQVVARNMGLKNMKKAEGYNWETCIKQIEAICGHHSLTKSN